MPPLYANIPKIQELLDEGKTHDEIARRNRSLAAHCEPVDEQGIAAPPRCRPGDTDRPC